MLADEVRRLGDEVGVPRGLGALGVDRRGHPPARRADPRRRLPDHQPADDLGGRRRDAVQGGACDGGGGVHGGRRGDHRTVAAAAHGARRAGPGPSGHRGAHRPALGQAALLPRVPHLGGAAAPGDPRPGTHLGGPGAHHRGLRGAGPRGGRGGGRPPVRGVGGVRAGRRASCRTPTRGTWCAARAAPSRRAAEDVPRRGVAAPGPGAPRHRQRRARPGLRVAGTCTCRSGWTAGWSAR